MPAKKKITKDAIIKTALDILRREGYEKLNARDIAKKLKCSTQPIYSEFGNMDALKMELKKEAERCYVEQVGYYRANSKYSPYMVYGLGFIRFAKEEKQLFRYLYMCERDEDKNTIEDVNASEIIKVLTRQYGIAEETARRLHYDMAIYTYGLAVTVNTHYMDLSEEQIIERLGMEFMALAGVHGLKSNKRA